MRYMFLTLFLYTLLADVAGAAEVRPMTDVDVGRVIDPIQEVEVDMDTLDDENCGRIIDPIEEVEVNIGDDRVQDRKEEVQNCADEPDALP